MRRLTAALSAVTTVAIAAAAAAAVLREAAPPLAAPGVSHNALHIACPPGSHGKPRYATFGRSLGYGRGRGDQEDLALRGITAGRPGSMGGMARGGGATASAEGR